MLWLARSLESADGPNDPFEPAIRGNLAAWSPLIHRLRDCLEHRGPVRVRRLEPERAHRSPPGATTASSGSGTRCVELTRCVVAPLQHAGAVRSLAFTRDGKTLATACDDQTARLWNTASGLPRGEPMRHRGPVVSVAFSPDDATLVTASGDGMVRLWDAATGEPRGKPLEHGKPLKGVVIAPDGKSIASIDETGCAVIWDVADGKTASQPQRSTRAQSQCWRSARTRRSWPAAVKTAS